MVKKQNNKKRDKNNKKKYTELQLTKIQKRIINYIQKNKYSLNYNYDSEIIIKSNKDLIKKIKNSVFDKFLII